MKRRVGVCLPDKSFYSDTITSFSLLAPCPSPLVFLFGITVSAAFERRDHGYLFYHYLEIVTNGSFSFDCGTSV